MAITPPGAGAFTTFHFVILALLILATLALIAVGIARSRARRAAERRAEAEADAAGAFEATEAPPPSDPAPPLARPVPPEPAPLTSPIRPEAFKPTEPHPIPLARERIVAPASIEAIPATPADPVPAAPSPAVPSPTDGAVTQLKGLGPKVATRLAELGLSSVGQIAALDADEAAAVDAQLGPFSGRLHRDRWVEQARFLAAGDTKGFEAVFGRL
ncbi:hypothetical protein [uncultured Sphingomonas sp.]|uniref:hypothetical protein n=1 Tax=uncultured Sphingomonas sp. TaxID=158754 RepID=UPI0035CAF083